MKVFAVLLLASYAVAHGGDDYHMFKNWANTKAMESCWGEENMKVHTVNMKKAVAKCSQIDAPELELPPYRSIDRFVNTIVSFANKMESNQFEQLYKMMSIISQDKYEHSHDRHSYGSHYPKPYSMDDSMPWGKKDYGMTEDESPMMNKFKMMVTFKKMMSAMKNDDSFMSEPMMPYNTMKSKRMDMEKFEQMYKMVSEMKSENNKFDVVPMARSETPNFEKVASLMSMMNFRSKREASGDALALNDRLKEKMEAVFEQQQQKVGNMTCVLREMNCLNAENEIDISAMKKDTEQYNMPSAWFKNRYEEIIDVCYEAAHNLPAKLQEQDIIKKDFGTVNMGKIKSFMSCCKSSKQKLCMNQDIKNKIETNFGPVEEILESFKYTITENQLFSQVNQLLQGSEAEYM